MTATSAGADLPLAEKIAAVAVRPGPPHVPSLVPSFFLRFPFFHPRRSHTPEVKCWQSKTILEVLGAQATGAGPLA